MQEIGRYALIFIGVVAICAIGYAFLVWSGIRIPEIIIWVFWIIIGACICALGVKIIMKMIQT
jgi:hypothetical protein